MVKEIKLSEYAKLKNRCYKTMWNKFHDGSLPNAYADEKGSIFIKLEEEKKEKCVVIYARVSSNGQKSDLTRQVDRLSEFTIKSGYPLSKVYKEVASGLNDKRSELQKMLTNEKITTIVIENKDRLTRFGFNYLETLLNRMGVEIIVASELDNSDKNDLMSDFISIVTSFCTRIYGQRISKNKIKQVITELEKC
jgi:predicted site-specific integrase-resolvase